MIRFLRIEKVDANPEIIELLDAHISRIMSTDGWSNCLEDPPPYGKLIQCVRPWPLGHGPFLCLREDIDTYRAGFYWRLTGIGKTQ